MGISEIPTSAQRTETNGLRSRRWTREEYHRAAALGLFRPEERLELIEGEIITTLSPVGSRHSITVLRVFQFLTAAFGSQYHVNMQEPITLNDLSEPEPDVLVAVGSSEVYEDHHPTPHELRLVVEVSDTTLSYDRTEKSALYARAGIPEYWIVDLNARHIEVQRDPAETGFYRLVTTYEERQSISPAYLPTASVVIGTLLPSPLKS